MSKIYLDYASTTPVLETVLKKMSPFFTESFGNPLSPHAFGREADEALVNSREIVSKELKCDKSELVFTSGATESNNIAIQGVSLFERKTRGANHVLLSSVEHPSVLNSCKFLKDEFGFEVEFLTPSPDGLVSLEELKSKVKGSTALVSIIYGNNEIGSINNISALGEFLKEKGIPFHTDATQIPALLDLNLSSLNVDLLTLSSHKIYGPKGVGALYIKNGRKLSPLFHGGSQEDQKRAGTHNIPGIVGFAEALKISSENRGEREKKALKQRDFITSEVLNNIPGSILTGHKTKRLPNHSSFIFEGLTSSNLLMLLDLEGFYCSAGSTCKVGNQTPSETLTSLGFSESQALGSLRVSTGIHTLDTDLEELISKLPGIVERARSITEGK